MANGKKSFVLYCDYIHTFNQLTDAEAGQLIKHLLAYVNDLNPDSPDKIISIAFEPIKQQLKRDLKDWETIREKRRLAGIASAEKKQQVLTSVDTTEQTSTLSTVNVTVTDTVTVNDTDKEEKKEKGQPFRADYSLCPDWMVDPLKLWMKHKAEKKQGYKETGFITLVEKLKTEYPDGRGFLDAVRHSISNNYAGIFPNEDKPHNTNGFYQVPDKYSKKTT